jgi:hypothetical protein
MIGTTGAAVIVIVNIFLAGVLGIGTGGVTCAVLRRPWSLKVAGIDAVLAMVVAVIAAYVLSVIEIRGGAWQSVVEPVFAVAAVSVVARHLARIGLHSGIKLP